MTNVDDLIVKASARGEADKYIQEARDILYRLLNLPVGFSSSDVDRFIYCVISATRLDIAADYQDANIEFK